MRGTAMRGLQAIRGYEAGQLAHNRQYDPSETEDLLASISETCNLYIGADLLAGHDAQLAVIEDPSFDLWCLPDQKLICMTRGFLDAIAFIAATYILRYMASNLQKHARRNNLERPELALFIRTLLEMQTVRLTLHMVGERPAPLLFETFDSETRIEAGHVINLVLAFALLHEQAHIELAKNPATLERWRESIALSHLRREVLEEHFADWWALERVPAWRRDEFFKPVLLFFVNQWLVDLIAYAADGTHPHSMARLELLAALKLGGDDGNAMQALAVEFVKSLQGFKSTVETYPLAQRLHDHLQRCRNISLADDGRLFEETAPIIAQQYKTLQRV